MVEQINDEQAIAQQQDDEWNMADTIYDGEVDDDQEE